MESCFLTYFEDNLLSSSLCLSCHVSACFSPRLNRSNLFHCSFVLKINQIDHCGLFSKIHKVYNICTLKFHEMLNEAISDEQKNKIFTRNILKRISCTFKNKMHYSDLQKLQISARRTCIKSIKIQWHVSLTDSPYMVWQA